MSLLVGLLPTTSLCSWPSWLAVDGLLWAPQSPEFLPSPLPFAFFQPKSICFLALGHSLFLKGLPITPHERQPMLEWLDKFVAQKFIRRKY